MTDKRSIIMRFLRSKLLTILLVIHALWQPLTCLRATREVPLSSDKDVLRFVDKVNAHIDEIAFLLTCPLGINPNWERLLVRLEEIERDAHVHNVYELINYPYIDELKEKIFISKLIADIAEKK